MQVFLLGVLSSSIERLGVIWVKKGKGASSYGVPSG